MLNLQAIVGEVTRKTVPPKVKTEETKIVHPKFADIKNQRFVVDFFDLRNNRGIDFVSFI